MASVNNPPNFKPLIDSQSTTQSTELTAAAQAISASIDGVKTELVGKSDSVKTAVNTAKTLIIDDAKVKTDALLVVVEAAKNAVLADISEKINELQLAVDAPKSLIKSIQRGVINVTGIGSVDTVSLSSVDMSKSVISVSAAGQNSVQAYFSNPSELRLKSNASSVIYVSWEVIEYV